MLTRSTQVADVLRNLIVTGQLDPGARLFEEPLAEQLGVSRTPLRAALSALAAEGLLDYKPKGGYRIRTFELSEILDAFINRAELEALAVRLATERGLTEARLATLRQCVEDGDAILAIGKLRKTDEAPYREMNMLFHETIIAASENIQLADLIRQTRMLPLASGHFYIWEDFELTKRFHNDHHRIYDALKAGEALRAVHVMREHIYSAGLIYCDYLRKMAETERDPRMRYWVEVADKTR